MPHSCRACGASLPPNSVFCPTCGASQTVNDHVQTQTPQPELAGIGTGRLPPGRMLHQRYRLLHTLAQGGMGAVYLAQDTQLGDRLVAIKEMSMSRLRPRELQEAIEQFRREAHLLASLHHPNLPAIHEYFREDERWYLVMSFIEGQNLQAALNAAPGNRLPVQEVVRIGIELCEVLHYLHTHEPPIIFRDLKPLNIMLTPKGQIRLIDFGIARHFKQEQTSDTAYYYSVGYAPPEQYGQSQTSPRSDMYSLGATLHQMLSGQHPASKPFQFPNLQLVDPTIPGPLARLIAQMLEMSEQARPASITVVKERLEHVLAPGRTEPTSKAVIEEKKSLPVRSANAAQPTPSAAAPDDLWGQIKQFLSKRRRVAWMGFIVLSLLLGGILPLGRLVPGAPWYQADPSASPFAIANRRIVSNALHIYYDLPSIAIIGAVGAAGVGLIFLLVKNRRPLVNVLGGIALSSISFLNLAFTQDHPRHYHDVRICLDYYCSRGIASPPNPGLSFFLFLALFLLWLCVGTRFFVRSANTVGRLLLGALLIIGALTLLQPPDSPYVSLSPFTLFPALICGVCGAVALRAAFRKKEAPGDGPLS